MLNETIKTDALSVIAEARRAVEAHDVSLLKELSDHTLHNTTIFQDPVSINTAILTYALYKTILHDQLPVGRILPLLKRIEDALLSEDEDRILKAYRHAFSILKREMRSSILQVMQHAAMQKARKVYEHGLSLAQAAALMHTSLWDIIRYVGLTPVHEVETGRDILQRVRLARRALREGRLVFDAGPVIAFTLTGVLEDLIHYAKREELSFHVPRAVERELIDHPLRTQKYAFEAYHVLNAFSQGVFHLDASGRLHEQAVSLLQLANSLFMAKGSWLRIVSLAEMSVIVHALERDAIAVIDERTARMLVEQPRSLAQWMSRKLHTGVRIHEERLRVWKNAIRRVRIIRSVDIAYALAEQHVFDHYLPRPELLASHGRVKHLHTLSYPSLVEALLWSLKLHGCSVSEREITRAVSVLKKHET